jgi:hypothetical protein
MWVFSISLFKNPLTAGLGGLPAVPRERILPW